MDPESSARVRMALAANPLTPNDVLIRLLTFADREPGVAAAICLHECAPPAVRIARTTADDADVAHALIRDANPPLPPEARLFAYAHLARMSGLEAVWTLELDRAGGLEKMDPAVRASMESGSAVPLVEAAVANPYRGMLQDAVTSVAGLRREEMLDWPFPWQDPDRSRVDQPGGD
jgi:hypothetical protein